MRYRLPLTLLLMAALFIPLSGCWFFSDKEGVQTEFVLGALVEEFDPPPLEELEQSVTWEDRPVLDTLELLEERQVEEEPLVSVEQALELRNTSQEANLKIRSALGRLPESEDDVAWDESIVRHSRADVNSVNPLLISSTAEFDVYGMIAFQLFSFDWNFRPLASSDAVVSWQTSEDRMYDKVVMRDDLTWSDGKPITAHDVVFSYKVIMSNAVPIPAVRSGTEELRWVEAYDDHTLVYFHKEPLATNVWNINFPVIPKHIYEKSIYEDPSLQNSDYHVRYEKDPVVGGPYEIVNRTIGKEIALQRRESAYMHEGEQVRPKPFFREVRFRIVEDDNVALLALKAGDIEEKELQAEEWVRKTSDSDFYKNNTKAYDTEWTTFHFAWNNETPWFSDKRVREAMSYAFDHQEMHEYLLFGLYEPSSGMFHPTSPWAAEGLEPYQQDVAKAEQLLDEAGWVDHNGDGIRDKEINGRLVKFEFSVVVLNNKERIDVCNLLSENLRNIGVICNVRPLEFTVLQEMTLNHRFHAALGGWGSGTDPDTSKNIWASTGDRNFVQYKNTKVDELFKAGARELDPQKRVEIYQRIHRLVYEDQPYTWLWTRNAFYGFNKDLRGYVFSPRGPYNYGPGFSSIWKPAAN